MSAHDAAPSSAESMPESPFSDLLARLFDGRSWVGQPAVSPDGTRIACVVSTIDLGENTTTSRVWLGGTEGDAAPITAGPHDAEPGWSPDGRFLSFTSRRGDRDKDTEATLHVIPITGPGEVRTVATMPEGFDGPRWSPDGRWLAFGSRWRHPRYEAKDERRQPPRKIETFFTRLNGDGWIVDRPSHVFVVATDGTGTPRDLTPGPFHHEGNAWLPDSRAVVTSAARHEGWDRDLAIDLHVVPLEGEIRALTDRTGIYKAPSVSPDGRRVAFLGFDEPELFPQNTMVGMVPIEGGGHQWISDALDRTFLPTAGSQAPVWISDDTLVATAENRGETHLYELDARPSVDRGARHHPRALVSGPATVHSFDARGGTVALARSTVERPAELATLTASITGVTRGWSGWERFAVPCGDGTGEIDAWVMRPADFDDTRTYPVLLNVHGGPFTQYGETFFDEAQMQAAAGFVVLMSNPRGSSGREARWGQAINGPKHPRVPGTGWGSVDVDDVLAVLDHALERFPFCDRERVGMLGGSYGGYMATTLAGRHSSRFRAVCTERAVNNWVAHDYSADMASAWRSTVGVTALDDPDEYHRMSPIRHVRDIDVPLLIIHSEDDLRCPINQAEELFVAMRLLDKDVTFYRFPGEDHELSRSGSPVHRKMRGEIILEFFTEHLRRRDERSS